MTDNHQIQPLKSPFPTREQQDRSIALGLAVQWTAQDPETTIQGVLGVADAFTRYIDTGEIPTT